MNLNQKQKSSIIKNSSLLQRSKGFPLPLVLVVPFVLQIFAAVGIIGYLSFRNGQKAVNDLALQLEDKIGEEIEHHVISYLEKHNNFHQTIKASIRSNHLDLEDFDRLEAYFWHQIKTGLVEDIFYANPQGDTLGMRQRADGKRTLRIKDSTTGKNRRKYVLDSQGNRTELIQIKEYNTLARPWYITAVEAGEPTWSEIYPSTNLLIPELSAVMPIYSSTGELTGVLGSELTLKHINSFLNGLKIGQSGQAFIMERDGELVASSTSEAIFTVVDGRTKRIFAQNSSNPLIRATARYLFAELNNIEQLEGIRDLRFKFNDEKQLVQIRSLKDRNGIDFLVVIAIPESDFMAEISANNRTTLLLCLASLLAAILLGLITSGWITRPIRRLSAASKAIANGDLDQTVEVKGVNELNVLAQSFNQMANQLRLSFAQLDTANQKLAKTNQELEQRVAQRTHELQIAKEQAEESQKTAELANKAKSTFLANMSHELRTPLNAILGFTQIMQRDRAATQKQLENLSIINRSSEHLLALINDVLDMSKIEAGRIALNSSSFNLDVLLNNTEEMLEFVAEAKELRLLFDKHPDLPQYIRTDERKLRQVLINLLNNALKFTTEGGVTLRVKSDAADIYHLVFEIEDTGAGIAPEELDTLFEAFTQTETGRNSEEGTGLGLPISRKFVQLMGGDVAVSSQLGVGTVFKFDIAAEPPLKEELQSQKQIKQVVGLEPNQPSYRILVVDDRWENRQIVLQLLQPIGFEVQEATNGKEAIAIWEQWQPHLIWMDMRMPVMNGYEATEYIKSQLKGQTTYIIALTASTFEEERAIVLSAGCDDFVRKPFRETVLFDTMAQYLGVKYVYADNQKLEAIKPNFDLKPDALEIMPSDWLTQLQQAASELDEDVIFELLTQIPDEHTLLAQTLQNKVSDFDFEDIVNLVEQTAKISSNQK